MLSKNKDDKLSYFIFIRPVKMCFHVLFLIFNVWQVWFTNFCTRLPILFYTMKLIKEKNKYIMIFVFQTFQILQDVTTIIHIYI